MMPIKLIACEQCADAYPGKEIPYRCPNCGGIYDWIGPFPWQSPYREHIPGGIWRWRNSFGLPEIIEPVSLGEGDTPLVMDSFNGQPVYYKMESLNPTGSYKDRASSILASFLRSRAVTRVVEDSSGNAGASFAAYAACAGIHARIFVPASASGPKRRQIETYGAELVPVSGPRSAASKTVEREVAAGEVYASHAYLPFGMAGIATIAYELFEQLGCVPGTVLAPAGHASLVLGILRGFKSLRESGQSDHLPVMIAVQSSACAPIWAAWHHMPPPEGEGSTLAEGVKVLRPVRMAALIKELDRKRDQVMVFDDDQVCIARAELARRGIDVEPTSALSWCGLTESGIKLPEPIVLVLTGSGLKYSGS
jgi:threonine synthase